MHNPIEGTTQARFEFLVMRNSNARFSTLTYRDLILVASVLTSLTIFLVDEISAVSTGEKRSPGTAARAFFFLEPSQPGLVGLKRGRGIHHPRPSPKPCRAKRGREARSPLSRASSFSGASSLKRPQCAVRRGLGRSLWLLSRGLHRPEFSPKQLF